MRWPLGFAACPACLTPTTISVGLSPTKTPFHAYEAMFERIYQRREEQRIAQKELAPEELGKREARQIVELERLITEQDGT